MVLQDLSPTLLKYCPPRDLSNITKLVPRETQNCQKSQKFNKISKYLKNLNILKISKKIKTSKYLIIFLFFKKSQHFQMYRNLRDLSPTLLKYGPPHPQLEKSRQFF